MPRYVVTLTSRYATIRSSVDAPTDELAQVAAEVLRKQEDNFHPGHPTEAKVSRDYAYVRVDPDRSVHTLTSLISGNYEPIKTMGRRWTSS